MVTNHVWLQASLQMPRLDWLTHALCKEFATGVAGSLHPKQTQEWMHGQYQSQGGQGMSERIDGNYWSEMSYAGVSFNVVSGYYSHKSRPVPAAGVKAYVLRSYGMFAGMNDQGQLVVTSVDAISFTRMWVQYHPQGQSRLDFDPVSSLLNHNAVVSWFSSGMASVELSYQKLGTGNGGGFLLIGPSDTAGVEIGKGVSYNPAIGPAFSGLENE